MRGLKAGELKATYRFPNLMQHALLVYRLEPSSDFSCSGKDTHTTR